jgi:putative DNA primase/helicase
VPRLIAAGADLGRVLIISAVQQRDGRGRRVFNLQADLDLLEAEIAKAGDVRLVIIDPVSSYMGKTDSHKNSDVRGTLEPLGEMAAPLRVAVVSITHFSKGGGASAINRFIGSIAFVAAARAAFIVTRDPDDRDRRLFVTAKNNLAKDSGGLAFRLVQQLIPLSEGTETLASAIAWEGDRIDRTADEVLAASERASEQPAKVEAEDFLRDLLVEGPRPTVEIQQEAKGAGISWRTINRAKKELGIKAERKAEAGDGLVSGDRWYWRLAEMGARAPKDARNSYECHVPNVAALGEVGSLRGDGGDL